MGNYKYALYTDKIYQYIFRENSKEYKQMLNCIILNLLINSLIYSLLQTKDTVFKMGINGLQFRLVDYFCSKMDMFFSAQRFFYKHGNA